jgi:hypothetical protein
MFRNKYSCIGRKDEPINLRIYFEFPHFPGAKNGQRLTYVQDINQHYQLSDLLDPDFV